MKNVIKNTKKGILMITMLAASLSFANEKTELTKIGNDAKTTALSLGYVKEGNQLSIVDKTGIVLYKETIQKTVCVLLAEG